MSELKGVKFIKDATGRNRYLQIDLDVYGDDLLIEELLDGLEAISQKCKPTYPFEEVMRDEFERRGLKYGV